MSGKDIYCFVDDFKKEKKGNIYISFMRDEIEDEKQNISKKCEQKPHEYGNQKPKHIKFNFRHFKVFEYTLYNTYHVNQVKSIENETNNIYTKTEREKNLPKKILFK